MKTNSFCLHRAYVERFQNWNDDRALPIIRNMSPRNLTEEFDRGNLSRGQLFCTGEDLAWHGAGLNYFTGEFARAGYAGALRQGCIYGEPRR